jgi:hypothetical protein
MTLAARVIVSSFALACAIGCSATTGSGWVREPEPGFFASDDVAPEESSHHSDSLVEPLAPSPATELGQTPAPRPRLTETVTLGETFAAYTERAPEARAADRSSVNVTVNNYVTPQNDSYDGYYGGYAVPVIRHAGNGGARPSHPIARPTRPGQGPGPAFPFKTAPGNPWSPAY